MCCAICFHAHLKSKIESEDVLPWIKCPAADCKVPVAYENLVSKQQPCLSLLHLAQMAQAYMRKKVVRNENYVSWRDSYNLCWLVALLAFAQLRVNYPTIPYL